MRPMLAMPATRVPAGADWVHEVKWDGMRVLADVAGGRVTLTSRTERDVTVAFPELSGLADQFEDMLLDGEIVAMRAGVPSFAALAERFNVTSHRRAVTLAAQNPATLMAFDLLRLYGVDLTQRSLADRRATLERLELAGPHWQVPPTFADGELLRDAARAQGLEGIVSKRLSSRYHPGLRSEEWLKFPNRPVDVGPHRRLAAGDRQHRPARSGARRRPGTGGAALPRPGRQRHRRQGRGRPGQGAGRPPRSPTHRSPASSRGRTRSARPSSTRSSSARCRRWDSPTRAGCGNPHTVGVDPT